MSVYRTIGPLVLLWHSLSLPYNYFLRSKVLRSDCARMRGLTCVYVVQIIMSHITISHCHFQRCWYMYLSYLLYMSCVIRKPAFCICENKCAVTAQLTSAVCFRYIDSKIPLLPKSKIQASSHLVCLHSPICVGPGRKPRRQIFSRRGSYMYLLSELLLSKEFELVYLISFQQYNSSSKCSALRIRFIDSSSLGLLCARL